MTTPRKHKVNTDSDLQRLCPQGSLVTLYLEPIDVGEELEVSGCGNITGIPDQDLAARIAGKVTGLVTGGGPTPSCTGIVTKGDAVYPDGVELEWALIEVTHVQVLEKPKPRQEVTIGGVELVFDAGQIRVNGALVTPAQVSAVAAMQNWTWPDDPTTPGQRQGAWLDLNSVNTAVIQPYKFRCGCVRLTLAELDEALDVCAAWLGWC